MTTLFHRLAVPTYFGGLPVNYDYINNATSGTPANADGQKSTGINVGTYFVAFGEDATSSDANRANQALALNTDYLDNLLHQDLAVPTRTSDVTPGSPVASVTLTGPGIFIGIAGDQLQDLFHLTDTSDNDLEVGSSQIVVASFTGGTLGAGFSSGNITITFNVSIPMSQPYRIWYGQRSNLANLPADAFTTMRIRSAIQVDQQVELLLGLLHGNGELWNAAWDNTIYGLNASVVTLTSEVGTLNTEVSTLQTLLANLHGNSEAYNAAWDTTIYALNQGMVQQPVMNWSGPISNSGSYVVARGCFSPNDQVWFAVGEGGGADFIQSRDFGRTWEYLGASLSGSLPCIDVAHDQIGNVVILTTGDSTYRGARSGYNNFTWVLHGAVISHTVSVGRLSHDDTATLFTAVYRDGTSGMFVDTSSDGITWTNQAPLPSPWGAYTGTGATPQIKAIPGLTIAAFVDGTNINVMHSPDGGVTWTNVQPAGFAVTSTTFCAQPAYDYISQTWFLVVYDTTSVQSQIFSSTNGGTSWSVFGGTIGSIVHSIACVPDGLVAVTSTNQIYFCGLKSPTAPGFYLVQNNVQTSTPVLELRAGGGGVMLWNAGDHTAWYSGRSGTFLQVEAGGILP